MAGRSTLLAGLRGADAARVAGLLRGAGYVIDQVETTQRAVRDLMERPAFDLVVLGVDSAAGALAARDLLTVLRAFRCPSRNAGCVVLADGAFLAPAHALAGCGANRVYPATTGAGELLPAIDQLLASGSNLSQRFSCSFQMMVHVGERWIQGSATDISAGGFLLSCGARLELRQRFGFRLFVPGDPTPVEGEAMAVRKAATGGVQPGVGARICSFAGDGCARYAAVLARLRRQRAEERGSAPDA